MNCLAFWFVFLFTTPSPQIATYRNYLRLVILHQESHQYADAEKYCKLAHDVAQGLFGEQSRQVAMTLAKIGQLHFIQGHIREADSSFQLSLKVLEQTHAGPTDIAAVLNNLAEVQHMTGNRSGAEVLIRKVIGVFETNEVADQRGLGVALHNLSTILAEQHRLPEAMNAAERSVRILERHRDSDDFAMCLVTLGQLELAQGSVAAAEANFQRALSILHQPGEDDNPNVAVVLGSLAVLYSRTGRDLAAEQLFNRSINASRRLLGPDHPHLLLAMRDYAGFLRARKRGREAKKLEAYVHEKYHAQDLYGRNVVDIGTLLRERR